MVILEVSIDEQTKITAKRDDDSAIGATEEFYKAFKNVFEEVEAINDGKVLQYKL